MREKDNSLYYYISNHGWLKELIQKRGWKKWQHKNPKKNGSQKEPKSVKTLEEKWREKYESLLQYIAENNRLPAQRETNLGKWVGMQRVLKKKNKLSLWKIELLEKIDIWTWDVRDNVWHEYFLELKQFVEDNGHTTPHSRTKLGAWVATQRQRYRQAAKAQKKIRGELSQERINLLESIEGWYWDAHEESWDINYNDFKRFVEDNGHACPNKRNPIEKKYAHWVIVQRRQYKKNNLSKEKIDLLESIEGWLWDATDKMVATQFKSSQ